MTVLCGQLERAHGLAADCGALDPDEAGFDRAVLAAL
jgi:hypothetical protein